MEIYDIHFKSIAKDTVQLTLNPHEIDKRERAEDVIGEIMGNNLIHAKFRLMKLLESKLS